MYKHTNPKIQTQIKEFLRQNLWMMPHVPKKMWDDMMSSVIRQMELWERDPDWERPVAMYGIRKKHKCIKKDEIGLIIDINPWMDRVRTAETHWYHILYRRKVTDIEWEEIKQLELTRRYWIWSYFITQRNTVDKIISQIVYGDKEYEIDTEDVIKAFETHYHRKINISKPKTIIQLSIFDPSEIPIEEKTIRSSPISPKRITWESKRRWNLRQLELFSSEEDNTSHLNE